MTTLKRRVLISSLAAAGLLASSGATLAADLDVSSIYGRGAPPNAHIMRTATAAAVSEPAVTQAYPEHASRTVYPGPTSGQETYAEDSTGRIHEENLNGTPLVEGRGMRQGVDVYASAPVYADPAYDVAAILGRSSPPAPENAPDFGQPA